MCFWCVFAANSLQLQKRFSLFSSFSLRGFFEIQRRIWCTVKAQKRNILYKKEGCLNLGFSTMRISYSGCLEMGSFWNVLSGLLVSEEIWFFRVLIYRLCGRSRNWSGWSLLPKSHQLQVKWQTWCISVHRCVAMIHLISQSSAIYYMNWIM